MELEQIRAQVFGIAHAINTQWKSTKQVNQGIAQQLGAMSGLLDKLEPLMQQWTEMGSAITQGNSPGQSLAPQTPAQQPKPEGGSAGKISPDAQPVMASWVAEHCAFAKKKKKHTTCHGCGGWVGSWMSDCPGCGIAGFDGHDSDGLADSGDSGDMGASDSGFGGDSGGDGASV